jgi:hypothetical protein
MKAGWRVERRPWSAVLDALRDTAEPHALPFEALPLDRPDAMRVRLDIPVKGAAALTAALTDLLTQKDAAVRLDQRAGKVEPNYACAFDIDWNAKVQISVSSKLEDNLHAWPLIVAFAAELARRLGGEPAEE